MDRFSLGATTVALALVVIVSGIQTSAVPSPARLIHREPSIDRSPPGTLRVGAPFRHGAAVPSQSAATIGVQDTTVLVNNSVVAGNYVPPFAAVTSGLVADPNNGDLFAISPYQNGVAKVNESSGTMIGWTTIPATPNDISVDPTIHSVLVSALYTVNPYSQDVILMINDSTGATPHFLGVPGGNYISLYGIAVTPNGSTIYAAADIDGQGAVQGWNASGRTPLPVIDLPGQPSQIAVDSRNGHLYVTETNGNVLVVNPGTGAVIKTLVGGTGAAAIVFADGPDRVFVADSGENNITAINASSNKVVGKIAVTPGPSAIVYSPATGDVYASSGNDGNMTVVNATSGGYVANVTLTVDGAFDAVNRTVLFALDDYGNFAVLNLSNESEAATFGLAPVLGIGIAFDPNDQLLFVPTLNRGVGLLNGTTGRFDRWIPLSAPATYPTQPFFDPVDGDMIVPNATGLVAINSTTFETDAFVPITGGAGDGAYDPVTQDLFEISGSGLLKLDGANLTQLASAGAGSCATGITAAGGMVFIVDACSTSVLVRNTTTLAGVATIGVGSSGTQPQAIAYDAATGRLFVTNLNGGTVSVISLAALSDIAEVPVYSPQIVIADDPAASAVVAVGYGHAFGIDASSGTVQSFSLGASAGGAAYDPGTGQMFVVDDQLGTVAAISVHLSVTDFAVTPSLAPEGTVVNISVGVAPDLPVRVHYHYSGLPPGCPAQDAQTWTCLPAALGNFTLLVTVSTPYSFNATAVAPLEVLGELRIYNFTADPASLVVNQTTGLRIVAGGGFGALSYNYSGLPRGCQSTNTSNLLCTPTEAGNFSVEAWVEDSVGSRANATLELQVTEPTKIPAPASFTVRFVATGLPAGDAWSVSWNGGSPESSSSPTIDISATNGSYRYTVGPPTGLSARPDSGGVTVAGRSLSVPILLLNATPWAVVFQEVGLAPRTNWSVDLSGTVLSGDGTSLRFYVANAVLAFSINATGGYLAMPQRGTVTVANDSQNVSVTFNPPPLTTHCCAASATAFPSLYLLFIGGGLVVLAVGGVLLLRRRRRSAALPPNETAKP